MRENYFQNEGHRRQVERYLPMHLIRRVNGAFGGPAISMTPRRTAEVLPGGCLLYQINGSLTATVRSQRVEKAGQPRQQPRR